MKKHIIIIILLSPLSTFAQTTWKFNSSLTGGYEHNVFQNPADSFMVEMEEEMEEDTEENEDEEGEEFPEEEMEETMISTEMSAPILRSASDLSIKHKSGNHSLYFGGDLRGTLYPGLSQAHQLDGGIYLGYRLKLNKKYEWRNRAEFSGLRGAPAELRTGPYRFNFSYLQTDAESGIRIRTGRYRYLGIYLNYRYKGYESASGEPFLYHAPGIEIDWSYRLKESDKTVQTLRWNLSARDRFYVGSFAGAPDEELANVEDTSNVINRNWLYIRSNLSYVLSINKRFYLEPSIGWISRHDFTGKGLDYREGNAGVEMRLRTKKFNAEVEMKYGYRVYPQLSIGGESNEKGIEMHTGSIRTEMSVPIGKGFNLIAGAEMIQRESNRESNSSFIRRSFFYYTAWTGISVRLQGNKS